jgi:hypothetical protein
MKNEINVLMQDKTRLYSLRYGAGRITGLYILYDGIEDFIEITFKNNVTKKFPISELEKFRIDSSANSLTLLLRELAQKINSRKFRDKYFFNQKIGVKVNADFVANAIASLSNRTGLSILDQRMLNNCIDSLVLEVSNVYKINQRKAKNLVHDSMMCA